MKLKFRIIAIIILSSVALSSCYEDELYPAANFSTNGFVPGFKWKLDATSSVSSTGKKLMYRWDYNEDQSQYDTPWLTDPVYIALDNSTNNMKFVKLQVKDEDGLITVLDKEVYRSEILYFFRYDTLRLSKLEIPYNKYNWSAESKQENSWWMRSNVLLTSSINVINFSDSLQRGSYINWQAASTYKVPNTKFTLPTKDEWQGLIDLFFGNELAGFNLQVNNLYGMGLGLNGYVENNIQIGNYLKCYYWTATEVDNSHAWALEVAKNSDIVKFVSLPKVTKCKVRLVTQN